MAIEYSNKPDFEHRQPSNKHLTEDQNLELNERQNLLLPEEHVGVLAGNLILEPQLSGDLGGGQRLTGKLNNVARLTGRLTVRKI